MGAPKTGSERFDLFTLVIISDLKSCTGDILVNGPWRPKTSSPCRTFRAS